MALDKTLPILLAQRKMKQSDLARMTGISTGLMSDYIGGRKVPSISKAVLMADALGISLDALVGREPQGTAAQREVAAIAFQMNEEGQETLIRIARGMSNDPGYKKSSQHGMVEEKKIS